MQSALAPAGTGAEAIAQVFWVMVAGALLVWVLVVAGALWAGARRRARPDAATARRRARWLVVGGGMVAPTLLLGALLVYGLMLMPRLRVPPPADGLTVHVTGEQWWWRVRYPAAEGAIELANEIHVPVGERVRFLLDSPDVIHAFWVPSLGGKVDMIPGRTTTLVLEPTRAGTYTGICAEFCGASHAFMRFAVVAEPRADFEAWLARQARPAAAPADALARRGRDAFLRHGCGACHAVRGTPARGRLGPDLTHVGSRRTLAAGVLRNDVDGFRRWIEHTHDVKPEAVMPGFGMLPEAEVRAIATWLEGLQ